MTQRERYGRERALEPPEAARHKCPECGREAEMIYRRYDGTVVGCEVCVALEYAQDETEVWEEG